MRQQLENRLIQLHVSINKLTKTFDQSLLSQHISSQIIRSSMSAALNYGEAQGAESRKDFIHKSSIVLKELRETHICLKIIYDSDITQDKTNLESHLDESNQLVAIFHKTVTTSKSKSIK